MHEPEDDMEDRLLLGTGFGTFIESLAQTAKVQLEAVVKEGAGEGHRFHMISHDFTHYTH